MAEEECARSEMTMAEGDGNFMWDEESKLYCHASSGFYHDPVAGWYYSCMDGLYYTFENGVYVPITCNKEEKAAASQLTSSLMTEASQVDSCVSVSFSSNEIDKEQLPSEWIEETLIDLYLSGYTNVAVDHEILPSHQRNERGCQALCNKEIDPLTSDDQSGSRSAIGNEKNDRRTPDCAQEMDVLTDTTSSIEEESWQAQYGQVIQVATEDFSPISVVDLWDWQMTMDNIKNKQVAKLIGRLARQSSKLHPSIPARGGLLKSAAILEVHLDLVRVASGRVYRLRCPSMTYVASVSTFDSSNPTKDWGFPDIFSSNNFYGPVHSEANNLDDAFCASSSTKLDESSYITNKKSNSIYRDRAAERRALHGLGRGLGQKYILDDNSLAEAPQRIDEVVRESASTSFGPESYARKILEGMGWKPGDSLGSTNNVMLEPLHPVGNKGCAGLGWNRTHH